MNLLPFLLKMDLLQRENILLPMQGLCVKESDSNSNNHKNIIKVHKHSCKQNDMFQSQVALISPCMLRFPNVAENQSSESADGVEWRGCVCVCVGGGGGWVGCGMQNFGCIPQFRTWNWAKMAITRGRARNQSENTFCCTFWPKLKFYACQLLLTLKKKTFLEATWPYYKTV